MRKDSLQSKRRLDFLTILGVDILCDNDTAKTVRENLTPGKLS